MSAYNTLRVTIMRYLCRRVLYTLHRRLCLQHKRYTVHECYISFTVNITYVQMFCSAWQVFPACPPKMYMQCTPVDDRRDWPEIVTLKW